MTLSTRPSRAASGEHAGWHQAERALAVSSRTGNLFIVSPQSQRIYEVAFAPQSSQAVIVSQIKHPNLAACVAACIDDQERVYASTSSGSGLEFARGQGNWSRAQPSVLDGLTVGSCIAVSISRSNANAIDVHHSANRNVLPNGDQ